MKRVIFAVLASVMFLPSVGHATLTQRQVDWLLMVVQEARAIGHEEIIETAQTVLVLETLAGEWKYDPEGIKGDGGDSSGPFQMQLDTANDVIRWFPYLKRDLAKYGKIVTDQILEYALLKDIRFNIKMGVHLLVKNQQRLRERGYTGQDLFELTVLSHKFGYDGSTKNPNAKNSWYRKRAYSDLKSVVRVFNDRMFKTYTVAKAY